MITNAQGDQLRRLLEVGRGLVSEHDPEQVLQRILEAARELTGARFAALGVLDEQRSKLERFLTVGIEPAVHRAIGDLPSGRGVLGVLIEQPAPLRLADVGAHPQSYGFPPAHPDMRTFLGVPIVIRGQSWGNLYLTEKRGGEFSEADEEAVVLLAQWAGTAIDNARLYAHSERRREQLEQAVRSLAAARDIAEVISGEPRLDRVLELIAKRGRALVGARNVLILLREGAELVVAATAGHAPGARGHRIPLAGSTSGQVLERGRPERISDVRTRLRISPQELGVPEAQSALIVPMLHRSARVGVLMAFDRADGDEFTVEDERLLRSFASSAASAVALNRSVEADRLRSTIAAADAERSRWARELHDQTLQSLGGLRVGLASAAGRGDAAAKDAAIRQAIEDIELEIANLRSIISDLRPSVLDDFGLRAAVEALLDRRRQGGLTIATELALPDGDGSGPLSPELETTIYRVVQEALTNVVKHARADTVRVAVALEGDEVTIDVHDDGVGFDPDAPTSGFGLPGMRERVYLAGGTLRIESAEPGTVVRARLPAGALAKAAARPGVERLGA